MPTTLGIAAADTAKNVANAGMGLLLQGQQDRRQLKQQAKLQAMEIQGQKHMTDYNTIKQMEMWHNTGYGAQMKQIKEAGLNPGLLYGMGGAGGQTTNVETGKVTGGHAPVGGQEIQSMIGMGIQRELLQAQKENIQADTANKLAENPNIPKTGQEIEARTTSLLQGVENAKAQKELTEVQTSIASIDEHIKGMTQNQAVAMAMTELRSATTSLNMLERQNDIDATTKQQKIDIIKTQLAGMLIHNELQQQQITASKEQVNAMWTEIAQKWTTLSQQERNTLVNEKLAQISGAKLTLEKQQTIMRAVDMIMNRLMPSASTVIGAIKPAL